MAYFCTKTGARLVAPGISDKHGGSVPEFDGSEEHLLAEEAAAKALRSEPRGPQTPPTEGSVTAAQNAAREFLGLDAPPSEPPASPGKPAPGTASPARPKAPAR